MNAPLSALVWLQLISLLGGARAVVDRIPVALRAELQAKCYSLADAIGRCEEEEQRRRRLPH